MEILGYTASVFEGTSCGNYWRAALTTYKHLMAEKIINSLFSSFVPEPGRLEQCLVTDLTLISSISFYKSMLLVLCIPQTYQ